MGLPGTHSELAKVPVVALVRWDVSPCYPVGMLRRHAIPDVESPPPSKELACFVV
jgi:hypothetical protein